MIYSDGLEGYHMHRNQCVNILLKANTSLALFTHSNRKADKVYGKEPGSDDRCGGFDRWPAPVDTNINLLFLSE